jgi:hypothetical protein
MKKVLLSGFYVLCLLFVEINLVQAQRIAPFLLFGEVPGDVDNWNVKISSELRENGFSVIGNYNPARRGDLSVIVITSSELQEIAASLYDKSMMVGALRIGIRKTNDSVAISMLNPEYQFNAWLGADMPIAADTLMNVANKAIRVLASLSMEPVYSGGVMKATHLRFFRYAPDEALFSQAIPLAQFKSFDEAIEHIEAQWKNVSDELSLVFRIVEPQTQKAVFGIALHGKMASDALILPVLGYDYMTILPYEIIVERENVWMLPVGYRFTFAFPELGSDQYKKLKEMSANIEESIKQLVH